MPLKQSMATIAMAAAAACALGNERLLWSWMRMPRCTWKEERRHLVLLRGRRQLEAGICVAASQQQGNPEEQLLPAELRDDPKFVRIKDDDPRFGPTALLLVGFEQQEIPKIRKFLKDMDGEFVKLLMCTKDMVKDTLWNCMNSTQPDLSRVEVAEGLPRICFLSGMTGEEIMTIVQTFPKTGVEEDIVFAALVPKNAETVVEEVMEEVMGDHQRLKGKASQ